jgi:hypothetical protein
MHPQAFLRTFWRTEIKPQVFVAMSFSSRYQARFENVIAPAIGNLTIGGQQLAPYRVICPKPVTRSSPILSME